MHGIWKQIKMYQKLLKCFWTTDLWNPKPKNKSHFIFFLKHLQTTEPHYIHIFGFVVIFNNFQQQIENRYSFLKKQRFTDVSSKLLKANCGSRSKKRYHFWHLLSLFKKKMTKTFVNDKSQNLVFCTVTRIAH